MQPQQDDDLEARISRLEARIALLEYNTSPGRTRVINIAGDAAGIVPSEALVSAGFSGIAFHIGYQTIVPQLLREIGTILYDDILANPPTSPWLDDNYPRLSLDSQRRSPVDLPIQRYISAQEFLTRLDSGNIPQEWLNEQYNLVFQPHFVDYMKDVLQDRELLNILLEQSTELGGSFATSVAGELSRIMLSVNEGALGESELRQLLQIRSDIRDYELPSSFNDEYYARLANAMGIYFPDSPALQQRQYADILGHSPYLHHWRNTGMPLVDPILQALLSSGDLQTNEALLRNLSWINPDELLNQRSFLSTILGSADVELGGRLLHEYLATPGIEDFLKQYPDLWSNFLESPSLISKINNNPDFGVLLTDDDLQIVLTGEIIRILSDSDISGELLGQLANALNRHIQENTGGESLFAGAIADYLAPDEAGNSPLNEIVEVALLDLLSSASEDEGNPFHAHIQAGVEEIETAHESAVKGAEGNALPGIEVAHEQAISGQGEGGIIGVEVARQQAIEAIQEEARKAIEYILSLPNQVFAAGTNTRSSATDPSSSPLTPAAFLETLAQLGQWEQRAIHQVVVDYDRDGAGGAQMWKHPGKV